MPSLLDQQQIIQECFDEKSGNLLVQSVQLFTKPFDSITATYPTNTEEVYQSRVGGISGTIQETVTVNYTDSTKALILNVTRS